MISDTEIARRLCTSPLFSALGEEGIKAMLGTMKYTVHSYAKGSFLAMRGETYDRLLILLQGQVAAQMQGFSGKVVTVETLKAPSPLASAILFSPDPLLPVNIVTESAVEVLSIPGKEVLRLFSRYPEVLETYLRDMGEKLMVLSEKYRLTHFTTIRQKVAGFLLDQASRQNTESPRLPFSKETMAEIFGVTRPALSRVFGQMEEEGYLKNLGRIIDIDAAALQELAEEEE